MEYEDLDWNELAQDKIHCRVLVDMVMELRKFLNRPEGPCTI